jgi:hypothetical protein
MFFCPAGYRPGMSEDCIFCSIVAGDIPGRVVYEDEDTLAFLDANPLAAGHTLVVPKEHYERMNDLPAGVAGAIGEAIATVAPAVESAVDAPASTIAYNNGEAAGQEVPTSTPTSSRASRTTAGARSTACSAPGRSCPTPNSTTWPSGSPSGRSAFEGVKGTPAIRASEGP